MKGELKVTWKRSEKKYRGFSFEQGKRGKLTITATPNVRIVDDAIKPGLGLETLYNDQWHEVEHQLSATEPESVFYVYDRLNGALGERDLGYLSQAGDFYLYEQNTSGFVWKTSFAGRMKMIYAIRHLNSKTTYFTMFVGGGGFYVYSTLAGLAKLSSLKMQPMGCFCKGRAFYVVDGHSLLYSAAYEPDVLLNTLDGGGKITVPSEYGLLTEVETLFDKVYMFFERAIFRVDVGGGGRDMRVEHVPYGGGKIFGKTVRDLSVDGGKVFFLAQDGVYAMNEHRIWRVVKNNDMKIARNTTCASAAFDGTYLVSYAGIDGKKHAIAVDANTEEWFFTLPFKGLSSCASDGYCVANGAWQRITYEGKLPSWEKCEVQTLWTDFGVEGLKTLECIELLGEGKCTVSFATVDKETTLECTFVDGRAVFDLGLRGRKFSMRIALQQGCTIRGMNVTMQSLKSKLK